MQEGGLTQGFICGRDILLQIRLAQTGQVGEN